VTGPTAGGPQSGLSHRILTEADYAMIGVQGANAGLDEVGVSNLIALVEREAFSAAQAAARQTAMSIVPGLLELVRNVHAATAEHIAGRLSNQAMGFGATVHRRCVDIARSERYAVPRHSVVQR
jgi:hypothetical protein